MLEIYDVTPTVCASEEITTSELKIEGDAQAQFPTNDFHTAQEINDLAKEVLELSMKPVKQDNISQRVKEEAIFMTCCTGFREVSCIFFNKL